jgi:hypothetical protein
MRPTAPRVRRAFLLALALCVPALPGCRVDCGFEPHCEGNTVWECEIGVDQLVGSGSPQVYPCLEPAPVCVERREGLPVSSDDHFFCAREPLTECDPTLAPSCEGTLLVSCRGGYVTAYDCTNASGTGRCGRRTPDGFVQCL